MAGGGIRTRPGGVGQKGKQNARRGVSARASHKKNAFRARKSRRRRVSRRKKTHLAARVSPSSAQRSISMGDMFVATRVLTIRKSFLGSVVFSSRRVRRRTGRARGEAEKKRKRKPRNLREKASTGKNAKGKKRRREKNVVCLVPPGPCRRRAASPPARARLECPSSALRVRMCRPRTRLAGLNARAHPGSREA